MDLWVVAAAAGAGYVAKNLQNLSLDKKESSISSSFKYSASGQSESRNLLQQLRDKTCPFRRLARKKAEADALGLSSSDQFNDKDLETGLASLEKNELVEDYNLCAVSKLPSDFDTEEKLGFEGEEVRNITRFNRGKLVRSWKHSEYSIRPLNPLGSFLDAEIYGDREREEEGMNGLIHAMSMGRAVLISGGNRLFTRSSSGSFEQFEGGQEEVKEGSADCIKESSVNSRSASLQGQDGILLFITGMIIGISSANMANKKVIDKLNKQLKQTQYLVEDLHEELDMKDMVTVKELKDLEEYLPPDGSNTALSNQEPNASPSDVKANSLPKVDQRNENVELMSKIEAELEAELAMLEQSMMESKMEIVSNVVELCTDFEPDIVQGDLKPMKGSEMHGDTSESENDTTDTNPNNNYSQAPNYAVCPWELSLRLHELIETRLQARVKELEMTLDSTKNGSQIQKEYSYTETRSSSYPHTPKFIHEHDEYNKILNRSSSRGEYKDQVKEDKELATTAADQGPSWEKQAWSGFMSDEDCGDGNDSSDESETLLLKRIIERMKSAMDSGTEDLRPRILDSSDTPSPSPSSSSSSDSASIDLFQVNRRTIPISNVPKNIPKPIKGTKSLQKNGHIDISDEALHKLEECIESPESTARLSDVTHESSLFPILSPTQSPPIQVMERGFDPNRISASVFSGPSTPVDWSAASNDSLFSIRIGNNSFSKDQGFRTSIEVQKPEELFKSTVVPEDVYRFIEADKSRDLCQSADVRSVELVSSKQNDKGVVMDSVKEPVIGITQTRHNKKLHVNFIEPPKVSVIANNPEKSEHVIQISDFPKKKFSCPMCHCSKFCHALYRCKKPSCSCNWFSCCFKLPSCSCKWLSCLTKCFSWPCCSTKCFSCKGCRCKLPSCCCTCSSFRFKCPSWPSCNFKCLSWSSCKCPSSLSCTWTCCSCWKSKPKSSRYQEDKHTTQPDSQASSKRQYACFSYSAYRSCCSCYSSLCCSC